MGDVPDAEFESGLHELCTDLKFLCLSPDDDESAGTLDGMANQKGSVLLISELSLSRQRQVSDIFKAAGKSSIPQL